jgi:hypothetical protein
MKATLGLLSISLLIGVLLFVFRPKNIEGPRAKPNVIKELGFPYKALSPALKIAFPSNSNAGGPRYDLLKKHPESLDHYLGLISEIGPRSAPHRFTRRTQRLAYMLNAYTAGLLAVIRDECPIQSVEDPYFFSGLFWRVSLKVGGELLSLNDIAAEISTLAYGDPKVLLAISRGMKANIPLRQTAWTPDNLVLGLASLESQLLAPPYTQRKDQTLILGAPFKWYEHRFHPSPKQYIAERHPQLTQGINRVIFADIDTQLDGTCHLSNSKLNE